MVRSSFPLAPSQTHPPHHPSTPPEQPNHPAPMGRQHPLLVPPRHRLEDPLPPPYSSGRVGSNLGLGDCVPLNGEVHKQHHDWHAFL